MDNAGLDPEVSREGPLDAATATRVMNRADVLRMALRALAEANGIDPAAVKPKRTRPQSP